MAFIDTRGEEGRRIVPQARHAIAGREIAMPAASRRGRVVLPDEEAVPAVLRGALVIQSTSREVTHGGGAAGLAGRSARRTMHRVPVRREVAFAAASRRGWFAYAYQRPIVVMVQKTSRR
jgi:hypothetical protein